MYFLNNLHSCGTYATMSSLHCSLTSATWWIPHKLVEFFLYQAFFLSSSLMSPSQGNIWEAACLHLKQMAQISQSPYFSDNVLAFVFSVSFWRWWSCYSHIDFSSIHQPFYQLWFPARISGCRLYRLKCKILRKRQSALSPISLPLLITLPLWVQLPKN